MTEYPQGRGYWKFNQKLLEDQTFVERTKEFITDFFLYNIGSADPHTVWDTFKCAFRGHSIQFASQRQKHFRLNELKIKKEIEMLTSLVDSSRQLRMCSTNWTRNKENLKN